MMGVHTWSQACPCCLAGQLFILHTIKTFGALMFAAVMTTRQFLSILVSSILFNNQLSEGQWWASCLYHCCWQKGDSSLFLDHDLRPTMLHRDCCSFMSDMLLQQMGALDYRRRTREIHVMAHACCRLGTAVVFVALYFKTFAKGRQAQQAPRSSPSKAALRSPGSTPVKSPKRLSAGKPQWDMESAGKRSWPLSGISWRSTHPAQNAAPAD